MAIPFIVIGAALLLTAAALYFWDTIFEVFTQSVLPFLREHIPFLAPFISDAFSKLDNVARHVRRAAKEAWSKVRSYIFHSEEEYTRVDRGVYEAKQTTYMMTEDPDNIHTVTTTRRVELDQMPDDVRAKIVQAQRARADILAAREQQMDMAS